MPPRNGQRVMMDGCGGDKTETPLPHPPGTGPVCSPCRPSHPGSQPDSHFYKHGACGQDVEPPGGRERVKGARAGRACMFHCTTAWKATEETGTDVKGRLPQIHEPFQPGTTSLPPVTGRMRDRARGWAGQEGRAPSTLPSQDPQHLIP